MASFKYIRPDEMWTARAAVSGPADADYQAAWLCDLRSGRPVLATDGSPTWTVTAAPPSPSASKSPSASDSPSASPTGSAVEFDVGEVNCVAALNTNVDDGRLITIGGSISAALTARKRADGISFHPWALVTEAIVSSITVAVANNSRPVIFGEFVAGFARELGRPIKRGGRRTHEPRVVQPNRWSSVPGYDPEQDRWHFSGEVIITQGQMDDLETWYYSTKRGTLPSLVIETPTVQDCKLVYFEGFEYVKQGPQEFHVTLNLAEQARKRWP